jgi:UDP-N-acetylmuramoylalanine--D-glutamate ligase
MNIEELKHKKILIVGYGKEGKATEEFIKKYLPHATYKVVDQKDGKTYLSDQHEYDIAIKSPGVQKNLIEIPYTTGTNLFFQNIAPHITIGVTGTKGKSTTASLIYEMVKTAGKEVRLTGNIGKPLISELMELPEKQTIYVCELSSYQLDDIKYSPHISVIVSLFPEHMNYHGSVEAYFEAKHNIIRNAVSTDMYIYNPKFQVLEEWAKNTKAFSIKYDTHIEMFETQLKGEHNKDNLKAAVTVARLFDIDDGTIERALGTFLPLPHRLEYVGKYEEIEFYDDAISTTPESTVAALNAVPHVKTIFLGGQDRGYDFTSLVEELKKQQVESIVLFPESGEKIAELMKLSDYAPRILRTKDMEKAVEFAYDHTPSGSVCLLSTASPSYSVWKNFEEKGDLFQRYVKESGYERQTKRSRNQ